jgi:hypothetical protein
MTIHTKHTEAINRARGRVERAELDLLVLIALKRARNGNQQRFPFRFSGKINEVWLTAYIKDNSKFRAHDDLVIDYYNKGENYFATPLPLAEALKKKMLA